MAAVRDDVVTKTGAEYEGVIRPEAKEKPLPGVDFNTSQPDVPRTASPNVMAITLPEAFTSSAVKCASYRSARRL